MYYTLFMSQNKMSMTVILHGVKLCIIALNTKK